MGPALIAFIVFAAFLSTCAVIYIFAAGPQAAERSEIRKRLQTIALRKPSEKVMPSFLKDELMSAIPALHKFLYSLPYLAEDGAFDSAGGLEDKGGAAGTAYPCSRCRRECLSAPDREKPVIPRAVYCRNVLASFSVSLEPAAGAV